MSYLESCYSAALKDYFNEIGYESGEVGAGEWDKTSVESAVNDLGYTLQDHLLLYGRRTKIVEKLFSQEGFEDNYFRGLAQYFNDLNYETDNVSPGQWDAENSRTAIAELGMTAQQHMLMYGRRPDLLFNINKAHDGEQEYSGEVTPVPASDEFQANQFESGQQEKPSIVSLPNEELVVAWDSEGQDGSEYGIYGRIMDDTGIPAGDEFGINTTIAGPQYDVDLAGFGEGGFVAVWESATDAGANGNVYGRVYDAPSNPAGDEFRLNTYEKSWQTEAKAASLSDGGFVTVWESEDQDGSGMGVYGQCFDAEGNPAGDEFRVNEYTESHQEHPAVTSLDGGGFAVAWESKLNGAEEDDICARIYNNAGDPVGGEFQLNSYIQDRQNGVDLDSLPGGGFVATWVSYEQDGSSNGVFGRVFDEQGRSVSDEFQVNSYTQGSQGDACVASLGDDFVVVWESHGQDGSEEGVYGQYFGPSGDALGDEFQINSHTAACQDDPKVASISDSEFAVVWESYEQDGSDAGVFGRVFSLDSESAVETTSVQLMGLADEFLVL